VGTYGDGETGAVGKMDSFEDVVDFRTATDKRHDSGIANIYTLDQSNPL